MTNEKKTVLIIEDEQMLRSALSDKFSNEGFAIIEAKNGEEGLSMALRRHPDMILLDIVMPVMDGITVLKKLGQDNWGKEAKIIILTNLSDAETVSEITIQGFHDYLVKSDWKIRDVVAKVKEKLNIK
jgi:DNA-binding response OmpR family regulator